MNRGRLENLRKRLATIASSAIVVIVTISVGLSLLLTVGDAPGPVHDYGLEFPSFALGVASESELDGLTLNNDMPSMGFTVGLPLGPFQHALLFGHILIGGTKKQPGTVRFPFAVPRNTKIHRYGSELLKDDGSSAPLAGAAKKLQQAAANTEVIELSVTTTAPGQQFVVWMYFQVTERGLTQWLGWGRQQLIVGYHPDNPVGGPDLHDAKTESGRAAQMRIRLDARAQQQFRDSSPEANLESQGTVSWTVPNNDTEFFGQATIENNLVRYFANLGPQLLFLALGVIVAEFLEKLRRLPYVPADDS